MAASNARRRVRDQTEQAVRASWRGASRARIALLVLVMMLMAEAAFAQCAMCRRALQSPEGQQMVAAFRSGILFLLAAPFVAFGTVATLAVRAQRRRSDAGPKP